MATIYTLKPYHIYTVAAPRLHNPTETVERMV